jgi:HAD superfamily hydrolase (TIGR01549 family)
MTRPDFIFFDLGNVLVFFDHEIASRQIAEVAKAPVDLIRQEVFHSPLQSDYERGLVSSREFVERLSQKLGRNLPLDETLEAASAIFNPHDAIIESIQSLRQAGFRLGILSNTCDAHWTWLMRQNYQVLGPWFDIIALSYEMQCAKPDLEIYHKAAEMAGVPGERIFFTDDRLDNIQGAEQAGWMTHQFTQLEGFKEKIAAWI